MTKSTSYIVADPDGDYVLTINSGGHRDDCDPCAYDTHQCPDQLPYPECEGPVGHGHGHDTLLVSEHEPWELEDVRREIREREERAIFGVAARMGMELHRAPRVAGAR